MAVPTQDVSDLELAGSPIQLEPVDSDASYLIDVIPSCLTSSWSSKAVSDKLSDILKEVAPLLVPLLKVVLIVAGHLGVLVLAVGYTSLWFFMIRAILGYDNSDTPSTPPTPPEKSSVQLSWFDSLYAAVAVSVWVTLDSLNFIMGIVGCFVIVASMGYFTGPYVKLVVDELDYILQKFFTLLRPWYMERIQPLFAAWRPSYPPLHDQVLIEAETENLGVTEGNRWKRQWLRKASRLCQAATSPFKHPGPRTQIIYDLLFFVFRITLHTVVHAAALFPPFAWSTMWSYSVFKLWQDGLGSGDTELFIRILWGVFILFWSVNALGALGLGCLGCALVLYSFVYNPLLRP